MTNIAELLKDAPKSMKLYSPLFGEVKFVGIDKQSGYPINVTDCKGNGKSFTEFGVYFADHPDAECLLFPSKDCRTWDGWKLPAEPKFKVGDWVVKKDGNTFYGGNYAERITLIEVDGRGKRIWLTSRTWIDDDEIRLWTIADAKDGDVLVNGGFIFIFKNIDDGNGVHYYCAYEIRSHKEYEQLHNACFNSLMGRVGNSYTHYTPAIKEQRDLLFKKMKEAGYEWDAGKKELRKIKPHYDIDNFKPKQWVLVRDDDEWEWALTRFSYLSYGSASLFVCINGASFQQCIPFEDNEKLLGTTDMCDEQYINW